MTDLRQRMLFDLQARNLAVETQRRYIHYLAGYARFFDRPPGQLGLEHVIEYQAYLLREKRLSAQSANCFSAACRCRRRAARRLRRCGARRHSKA